MVFRSLVSVLCLAAGAALAEGGPSDGIAVEGLLSDAEFYRLATCGAAPGGPCLKPALRWDKERLTVRLARDDTLVLPGFSARLMPAIRHAIAEINKVSAGINLTFTTDTVADITIRPTTLREGYVLVETPGFSGAGVMGVGFMTVWSDERDRILEAVILISTSITDADLPSVMLEEVTQSLGFLYDIEAPAYDGVSILSQASNETVTITGQDARLLRRHYPKDGAAP